MRIRRYYNGNFLFRTEEKLSQLTNAINIPSYTSAVKSVVTARLRKCFNLQHHRQDKVNHFQAHL